MSNKDLRPFHLAIPVYDLERARKFYIKHLGCTIGRRGKHWIDLNLFGHQLVLHKIDNTIININSNLVDEHNVPVPHFGIILTMDAWNDLSNRLVKCIDFIIKPYIRFKGEVGEQATMFFLDSEGNAIEFKAFNNDEYIFSN